MSQVNVLGTNVDILKKTEVNRRLLEFIQGGQSHFVVTANTEMYYQAYKDREFQEILNQADLAIPDSVGIKLGAILSGGFGAEIYPGVDLAAWLLANKFAIYIVGAQQRVLDKLSLPNIVGKQHGYFTEKEEYQIIMDIQQKRPQVLLVALGAGRQERWIAKYKKILNIPVIIGVGGAIDVLSGVKKRAPKIWRTLRLEWLYRLITEPTRTGRQLNLIFFLGALFFGRRR